MKNLIAILATVLAAGSLSAFGQGYFEFTSGSHAVYDGFTTPGTTTYAPGDVEATFLWSSTGANDLLGAGTPTSGSTSNISGAYGVIQTMMASDGWNVATVLGGSEADVLDHASGPTIGGLGYGTFVLNMPGLAAGATIDVVVVGWASADGTTLAAGGASGPIGWSNEFSYSTGASSTSPLNTVTVAGMTSFGVYSAAPVPEPTTLALAGLGGLSMLALRRRKA